MEHFLHQDSIEKNRLRRQLLANYPSEYTHLHGLVDAEFPSTDLETLDDEIIGALRFGIFDFRFKLTERNFPESWIYENTPWVDRIEDFLPIVHRMNHQLQLSDRVSMIQKRYPKYTQHLVLPFVESAVDAFCDNVRTQIQQEETQQRWRYQFNLLQSKFARQVVKIPPLETITSDNDLEQYQEQLSFQAEIDALSTQYASVETTVPSPTYPYDREDISTYTVQLTLQQKLADICDQYETEVHAFTIPVHPLTEGILAKFTGELAAYRQLKAWEAQTATYARKLQEWNIHRPVPTEHDQSNTTVYCTEAKQLLAGQETLHKSWKNVQKEQAKLFVPVTTPARPLVQEDLMHAQKELSAYQRADNIAKEIVVEAKEYNFALQLPTRPYELSKMQELQLAVTFHRKWHVVFKQQRRKTLVLLHGSLPLIPRQINHRNVLELIQIHRSVHMTQRRLIQITVLVALLIAGLMV